MSSLYGTWCRHVEYMFNSVFLTFPQKAVINIYGPIYTITDCFFQNNISHVGFEACCLLHAGFLRGLFFDPEGGGSMFLKKSGNFQRTMRSYIS
jgi:hypothetical protein